jgi:hypothetical protein
LRHHRTYRKHLIGLVKDEHLHAVGLEEAALNHVLDTTGGTDNDLRAVLEGLHVITNAGATNAGVALNVHEVADGDNDLLDLLSKLTGGSKDQGLAGLDRRVDLLEDGDGERSRLASTRLGLGNDIVTLDDGHDSALLNGRGALETVGVNFEDALEDRRRENGEDHHMGQKLTTTEELSLEAHVIERVDGLIVVGLDLSCRRIVCQWLMS